VHEIRAGVGSLREIANISARSAVAKHSSRRLRKSFAMLLPLAVVAFVLAGALFILGGSEGTFLYHAVGALLIGILGTVELVRSWKKIKTGRRHHGTWQDSDDESADDGPTDDGPTDDGPALEDEQPAEDVAVPEQAVESAPAEAPAASTPAAGTEAAPEESAGSAN